MISFSLFLFPSLSFPFYLLSPFIPPSFNYSFLRREEMRKEERKGYLPLTSSPSLLPPIHSLLSLSPFLPSLEKRREERRIVFSILPPLTLSFISHFHFFLYSRLFSFLLPLFFMNSSLSLTSSSFIFYLIVSREQDEGSERRGIERKSSLSPCPSFLPFLHSSFLPHSIRKKTKDMRENEKRNFLLFLFFISPSLYPSLLSLPSQDFTVAKEENEKKERRD